MPPVKSLVVTAGIFMNTLYNISLAQYVTMTAYMHMIIIVNYAVFSLSCCSSWHPVSSRLPRQYLDWVMRILHGLAHSQYQQASLQLCHGCLYQATPYKWSWLKVKTGTSNRYSHTQNRGALGALAPTKFMSCLEI